MTDFIDQTLEREERVKEMWIQAAREGVRDLKGPTTCKCGGSNDRAVEGFAVCSACMEEIRNGQV